MAALATTMAGCAGSEETPTATDATVITATSPTTAEVPATKAPTTDPLASGRSGADDSGPEPVSPGPLDGALYLIDTQNVVGPKQVEEYMSVPLEDTEEAAFHTAFIMMSAADQVYATGPEEPGDLSLFSVVSAPECAWCASVLDTAHRGAASNLRVTGGRFSAVGDSFDGGRIEDGSVVVNIPVDEAPTLVWNVDGTLADHKAGSAAMLNIQLEWRGDMWKVTGVSTA